MEYSFKKNKLIGFVDSDDEFWEGLEEGVFRLCRCVQCKRWLWDANLGGPNLRCGECGGWDQEWIEVEPTGTIYAWIRTNQPFAGVIEKDDVPYVTIDTEIGGPGGPRVMGILKGSEDGLKVGAPVHGTIDPPSSKTKGYASVRWTLD